MDIYNCFRNPRPAEPRPKSPPKKAGSQVSITVPEKTVARMIGKNGDNVRKMIEQSGCNIYFRRESEGIEHSIGETGRFCDLKGSSQSISVATKLILEELLKIDRL